MIDDKYLDSLKSKVNNYIVDAQVKYEKLKLESSNITSYYDFNAEVDELVTLIVDILFLKKQLVSMECLDEYNNPLLRPKTDKEITEFKHKKLLVDKKVVEEQMRLLDEAISSLKEEPFLYRLSNKLEMEKFYLGTELGKINSGLRIYELNPDLTDNEIDIYIKGNESDVVFTGVIYLHGTGIEVGVIEYRGSVNSKWLGDIGYTIDQRHRGNNYAYKALKLVFPLILSKGIEKVMITTFKENVASIKTIEKIGGKLKEMVLAGVLAYECDLKQILEKSQKQL